MPFSRAAVFRGSLPLVDLLLKRGANVNYADSEGMTALHWVVSLRHVGVLSVLIPRKRRRVVMSVAAFAVGCQ